MRKLLFLLLFPLSVFCQPRYDLIDQTKIYGGTGTWIVTGSGTAVDTIKPAGNGKYLVSKAAAPGFEFQDISFPAIDTTDIANFYVKVRSLFSATAPATYSSGIIGVDTTVLSTRDYAENQVPGTAAEYFTIILSHGNHSPNDATANYFGWRLSQPAEGIKFNNPAVVPLNCTIVRADMSWRAATCASNETIDFYISVWSAAHPPVLQTDDIVIQHDLTCDATTGTNNWASSGTLAIDADAGELLWGHYIGPWSTNPINLTLTIILLCQKR